MFIKPFSYSSEFVSIRQPLVLSTDNASFKAKNIRGSPDLFMSMTGTPYNHFWSQSQCFFVCFFGVRIGCSNYMFCFKPIKKCRKISRGKPEKTQKKNLSSIKDNKTTHYTTFTTTFTSFCNQYSREKTCNIKNPKKKKKKNLLKRKEKNM